MNFVDRVDELARLERMSQRPDGALAVIWGRRRIGKTRLLLEWVRRASGVYWTADQSAPALQRRSFAETLELRVPGFGSVEYRDWPTLLQRLARECRQVGFRGPIVLDELPYLVQVSPELPAALQRFVDQDARAAGLLEVLAGSSQRMMQGLVLDHGAPLYGRATEAMNLRALPAGHLTEGLGLTDPREAVEAWACFGGVPRYWELAAPFGTLREAVHDVVLDPLGALFDEPSRLLLEELPPAVALRPILDAVGAGCHRVSEIAGRIGQPATSLARPLARLQQLDLVIRETPFDEPPRSSKRSLYKVGDPFLRLWFQLVGLRRSLLMQIPKRARLAFFDAAFPRLVEASWEELCRAAVPYLGEELGAQFGPAGRQWSAAGPEWDVLSDSLDGSRLLVGEVKWTHKRDSSTALTNAVRALLTKGPPSGSATRSEITRVVFVPEATGDAPPGIRVVTAADVLRVLR